MTWNGLIYATGSSSIVPLIMSMSKILILFIELISSQSVYRAYYLNKSYKTFKRSKDLGVTMHVFWFFDKIQDHWNWMEPSHDSFK